MVRIDGKLRNEGNHFDNFVKKAPFGSIPNSRNIQRKSCLPNNESKGP